MIVKSRSIGKTQFALQGIVMKLYIKARVFGSARTIIRLYSQNELDDIIDEFVTCANECGDVVRRIDTVNHIEVANYDLCIFSLYSSIFNRYSTTLTLEERF